MCKMYALSSIAHKLSLGRTSRPVSEDSVYQWVRAGILKAERASYEQRGCGKYHLLVKESHLIEVLRDKGYDVEALFPNAD